VDAGPPDFFSNETAEIPSRPVHVHPTPPLGSAGSSSVLGDAQRSTAGQGLIASGRRAESCDPASIGAPASEAAAVPRVIAYTAEAPITAVALVRNLRGGRQATVGALLALPARK